MPSIAKRCGATVLTALALEASRSAALDRLSRFVELSGRDYRAQRNYDRGPGQHRSVSGLSPYIRHRLVTEQEVVDAVLKQHPYRAAEKFVQEVFWRTYWKGWLEQRPAVWERYLTDLECAKRDLAGNEELSKAYQQATEGITGIDPFDAWVVELVTTGYLHNHARMWFASIWIFTLKLPWTLGADFFLRHLLDGDPASNTLSWRWVAGLHTRGKTYLATKNNIEKYASERFLAAGQMGGLERLSRHAQALVEDPLPDAVMPHLPPDLDGASGYGLLLTEEDLSLGNSIKPQVVAAWLPPAEETLAVAPMVRAFKSQALEDTMERSRHLWPEAAAPSTLNSLDQVVAWVQTHALRQVVTAYVPQGHLREGVEELRQRLAAVGCELNFFLAEYDRLAWPHCTKGFFQLKKKMPDVLWPMRD